MDIKKYNIPVPRYTSYPTVPFWNIENFTLTEYQKSLQTAYWASSKEVSLYIHLPFCESLCTYCACNTRITKNHDVEHTYIDHLLQEWDMYLEMLPDTPKIREVHLGGGTPTFFSPDNLERLMYGIFRKAELLSDARLSFEGHPANTRVEHLELLYKLGFTRLSLGIQDFDLGVQQLINRLQTVDQVKKVVEEARAIGYSSINFDMVYGLPGQSLESLGRTLEKVNDLAPDRIAYYSYAHVPKMRPAQRSFEEFLPSSEEKFEFMQLGKQKLVAFGYEEVGMDHFVKPKDELMLAFEEGELHRNFMGYTAYSTKLMIGLGASAIGDSWTGFVQNEKTVESYYGKIESGLLPVSKGHIHSHEDLFLRQQILNLMCDFETSWNEQELIRFGLNVNYSLLDQLASEGFIEFDGRGVKVLKHGRELLRVICSALDGRLNAQHQKASFSSSI